MKAKKRSPQEWQQIIEAQQASGQTIATFCKQHKLNPSTFYLQRKKITELSLPTNNDWLAVEPNIASGGALDRHWQIELKLPNGVVLNMSTEG